jgi:hypothetical protein
VSRIWRFLAHRIEQIGRLGDWDSITSYLLSTNNFEHVLDIVELAIRAIDNYVRARIDIDFFPDVPPDEVIDELNTRFREHAIGFEYVSGELIRIDSQLIHKEVVKPALALLSDIQFSGPNEEFLKAHEHYRHGRYKECLNESLKAFESTMKTICDRKQWPYTPRDTARTLIEICMNNGLFPTFMQTHLGNLRSILESGVPTVRNKLGGHGQGASVTVVPQATAGFALHTTAAVIVFFVDSANALP